MTLDRKAFLRRLGAGAAGLAAAGAGVRAVGTPGPTWPPAAAPDTAGFWDEVRAQYALPRDRAYLNCGGLGPSPRPVRVARDAAATELEDEVETGHERFEEARGALARFLGAEPDEVCLTRNATEGNSIIAGGLDLRPGDEVVFESHAHPGGSLPWLNQARRRGLRVRVFPTAADSEAELLERLAAELSDRTRVIQVSHVTAPTGVVMPVRAIARLARERGAWFHVDGAQSAGMIPVDVRALDCDSFATSGHKWLGGPRESGVLYLRTARLEEVAPTHAGAHSSGEFDFAGRLEFARGARRHEYGTRQAATALGLAAAARFQEEIGRERIAARGAALAERLHAGLAGIAGVRVLTPRDPARRAAMTTFALAGWPAGELFGRLLRPHGLRCRPVTEDGLEAIRVSTHLFNTAEECDRVVAAVATLSRESR